MMSALESLENASAVRRGIEVWFAVLGGLGAWAVHLVAEASLVRWTANAHTSWVLHAITAGCIVVTVVAGLLCWRLRTIAVAAGASDGEGRDDTAADGSQLLFLSHLGLLFNTINLALIVIEGAYAVFLYQPHNVH